MSKSLWLYPTYPFVLLTTLGSLLCTKLCVWGIGNTKMNQTFKQKLAWKLINRDIQRNLNIESSWCHYKMCQRRERGFQSRWLERALRAKQISFCNVGGSHPICLGITLPQVKRASFCQPTLVLGHWLFCAFELKQKHGLFLGLKSAGIWIETRPLALWVLATPARTTLPALWGL